MSKKLDELLTDFLKEFEENLKVISEKLKSLNTTPTFGEIEILGRNHKTVIIGNREYLAENLYCPELGSHYDNDPKNSDNGYGTLHTHYAIPAINELLPEGWRVMSDEDWTELVKFCGEDAGKNLKSKEGWKDGGNGADEYGFNSKPAGYYSSSSNFYNRGIFAAYWSSSVSSATYAWYRQLDRSTTQADCGNGYRPSGFSIRCVRNLK